MPATVPEPLEVPPAEAHPPGAQPPTRRDARPAASGTDGVRVRIPGTGGNRDTATPGTARREPAAPALPEPDLTELADLAEAATPVPSPVPAAARGRHSEPRAGDDIDPAARTPRSFHLSRQLLERARAAAHWVHQLGNTEEPTNVSELVERALRHEVERLEREYNDGQPFPAVQGRMRSGPGAAGVERIRRAQRARHSRG